MKRKVAGTAACRHCALVKAVRSLQAEIILHRCCKSARADGHENARHAAAHVGQLETGRILPLVGKAVCRHGPSN